MEKVHTSEMELEKEERRLAKGLADSTSLLASKEAEIKALKRQVAMFEIEQRSSVLQLAKLQEGHATRM